MAGGNVESLRQGRDSSVVDDFSKRHHAISLHCVATTVNTACSDFIATLRGMKKAVSPIRKQQGVRLAQARKKAGWTSARAAALANNWPESTYRSHEAGTRTIGDDDAERYARRYRQRAVRVTAKEILFGTDEVKLTSEALNSSSIDDERLMRNIMWLVDRVRGSIDPVPPDKFRVWVGIAVAEARSPARHEDPPLAREEFFDLLHRAVFQDDPKQQNTLPHRNT